MTAADRLGYWACVVADTRSGDPVRYADTRTSLADARAAFLAAYEPEPAGQLDLFGEAA